jgi:ribose transport system permease protein
MSEAAAIVNTAPQRRRRMRGLAVTLALFVLFSIFISGFATLGNFSVILSNSAALVILSCGMAIVIISRGLDLSLIAAMVAGAATFGILIDAGYSLPLVILLTLLAMAAIGFVNGWLIAYVEIPAMLATLASAMW